MTWNNLSMTAFMRCSFRVKGDVNLTGLSNLNGSTACTPGELSFTSNLSNGNCSVDAPTITTKVKRVQSAASGPNGTGGGNTTIYTANNQSVYSWGTYKPCGVANLHVEGFQNCLNACGDVHGFFVAWGSSSGADDCYCQTKSQYLVDGVVLDAALAGYTICENPAKLKVLNRTT